MGVPPVIIHFHGIFHDKPSILGYPHGHGNPMLHSFIWNTRNMEVLKPSKFRPRFPSGFEAAETTTTESGLIIMGVVGDHLTSVAWRVVDSLPMFDLSSCILYKLMDPTVTWITSAVE